MSLVVLINIIQANETNYNKLIKGLSLHHRLARPLTLDCNTLI